MRKLRPNYNQNGIFFMCPHLLKFQSNYSFITDNDINDLFMGLVGLIRKTEGLKIEKKYTSIIDKLKQEIIELRNQN